MPMVGRRTGLIDMHIYYRISDAGYAFKQKPEYITKTNCLRNFVKNFGDDGLNLIFDNCKNETITACMEIAPNAKVVGTSLGNAGSFLYAFDLALQLPDDEVVYMAEDDYACRPGSRKALLEGLEIADYVSLYSNPDKESPNRIQPEYIFRSNASYWRSAESTCMTFSAKVGTLRQDQAVLRRWCSGAHPKDHEMFLELRSAGRLLITPLPSFATHGEVQHLAPFVDWETVMKESLL